MPLGGLGCGTLEVFPDGTRGRFTGLNNWERPLEQLHPFRPGTAADFRHANPFGVFVAWQDRRAAKLLQRTPVADCPLIQSVRLAADFPIAELTFDDADLPLRIRLTHFSPFIPHDSKHSGLPVVASVFQLTNPTASPMTVGLLACCVNAVGSWNVGRYNRIVRQPGLLGLECRRRPYDRCDERLGELVLMTEAGKAEVSYLATWMYAAQPFRGNREDRRLEAWKFFAEDGRLPNDAASREAMGELDEPMGALAVRLALPPGETREAAFFYSWFMPRHRYGHQYARWFRSAGAVAGYVSPRWKSLLEQTRGWQQTIRRAPIPGWLADGAINSLAVYPATSLWTRDGRFAMYETPVKWPLMDSLDVRYYGTLPLACWFPELERSTLLQFARAQRPDGRIPHDLGRAQLDCPSDGTTAGPAWKDLATKFTLMAYRDVLWGGGRRLLTQVYGHVKRAMQWEFTTDRNGDGLPDHEGQDSTYDLWQFFGACSYTGSIFLAALKAAERMAQLMRDPPFARTCRRRFRAAARAMEERLWAGTYYLAARRDDDSAYEACIVGQLNGQWYAHLLGLGYLLPPEHVKQSVETVLRLNGQASPYGAVNAVFPDGAVDGSSYHAKNIWPGETYAFCALAIYEGVVDEGLVLAQKVWEACATRQKRPWSQADVMDARDGTFGDGEFYLRNVAIWAVLFALARQDARVRRALTGLIPHVARPRVGRRLVSAGGP